MVEVTVEDVIIRSPKAVPGTWLAEPGKNTLGWWRIVLLRERGGDRVLPIWLNPFDGDQIAMQLVGLASFRPMPHDLIGRLLRIGDMHVEKVAVVGLREKTYIGTMWIRAGDTVHEIDARPSDAIHLALDSGAPIFVTEETFQQGQVVTAGHELQVLEAARQRAIDEGSAPPDAEETEWRRFRSLPRHAPPWVRPREAAR